MCPNEKRKCKAAKLLFFMFKFAKLFFSSSLRLINILLTSRKQGKKNENNKKMMKRKGGSREMGEEIIFSARFLFIQNKGAASAARI